MKKIWTTIVAICLSGWAFANDFTLNQGFVAAQTFYQELRYEKVNGLVVVPVTLNGKIRRFLLDTGAPTMIRKSIQKKAKFETLHTIAAFDINDQRRDATVVRLGHIALGSLELKDIPALLADDDNTLFNFLDVDGIIGSNMLRDMVVKISAAHSTVTFTNAIQDLSLSHAFSQEMSIDKDLQSSPVLQVSLGEGITEELLFDTGFDGFYSLSSEKYQLFKDSEEITVLGTENRNGTWGMYGEPEAGEKHKLLIPRYIVGDFLFTNVIAFTSNGANSKLGAELLKTGDVTLDYIHQRFYFQPYNQAASLNMQRQTEAYYCVN